MKSEVVKTVLMGLVIGVFILWLAGRRELSASLVVMFIVAFAVVLPLTVLLVRLGRLR